jgi:hypothetical protein
MQNTKYTCDFCDEALATPWFQLKACRYAGMKVVADFYFRVCEQCYTPVHTAVKTAVHERIKQVFLEVTAKYRQDAAAKIRATTFGL